MAAVEEDEDAEDAEDGDEVDMAAVEESDDSDVVLSLVLDVLRACVEDDGDDGELLVVASLVLSLETLLLDVVAAAVDELEERLVEELLEELACGGLTTIA
jgi:hypothetical protein